MLRSCMLVCGGLLGLVYGLPGQPKPSAVPSLLMSAVNNRGTSIILRQDNYPTSWIDDYRHGGALSFIFIKGSDTTATAFRALATHHENGMIFWSNPLQKDIEWMPNIRDGNVSISDVHLRASDNVNGLAVDWLSHNLYWVDTTERVIVLSSVTDPHLAQGQSPYHKRILDSTDGLQEPWGVAVDPMAGRLYWTDAELRTVNDADLAGNNRRVLYQGGLGERPTSMCLDHEGQVLYWIDELHMAVITMSTVPGSDVTHLHDYVDEGFVHLRGLALYKDYLFTTGTPSSSSSKGSGDGALLFIINRFNVYDNLRLRLGPIDIVELRDVDVLAPQPSLRDDGDTPVCDGQQCPHICVGYQDRHHLSCLCADGYTLDSNDNCRRSVVAPIFTPPPDGTPTSATMTTSPPTTKRTVMVQVNAVDQHSSGSSTETASGGLHTSVVIAIAVSIAGLVAVVAIIALLLCFLARHRTQTATTAAPPPVTPPPTAQSHNNPTYDNAEDRPPPYMCAMGPAPENVYANMAFTPDDDKEEKKC